MAEPRPLTIELLTSNSLSIAFLARLEQRLTAIAPMQLPSLVEAGANATLLAYAQHVNEAHEQLSSTLKTRQDSLIAFTRAGEKLQEVSNRRKKKPSSALAMEEAEAEASREALRIAFQASKDPHLRAMAVEQIWRPVFPFLEAVRTGDQELAQRLYLWAHRNSSWTEAYWPSC